MQKTLAEIAELCGGEVVGDASLVITGLCGISEAEQGDLTFVSNSKYFSQAKTTKASAIIAPQEFELSEKPYIRCENPSLAFSLVAASLIENLVPSIDGVHDSAVISSSASLSDGVGVGANAVIENDVKVSENTLIYAGCYVGKNVIVGKNCVIYPNVTLRENTVIGDDVIIHSGTVIGCDGFGYERTKEGHTKIPQLGNVEIGSNVEIGANVTIDRARFKTTVISRGTKIDNLVQIAHNVQVGEDCIIVSQAGISGSVVIEKDAILAGQVGVAGHLRIGAGSIIAAQSGVSKDIPAKSTVWGYPAKPLNQAKRVNAATQRLPETLKVIQDLKKRIEELEKKINES